MSSSRMPRRDVPRAVAFAALALGLALGSPSNARAYEDRASFALELGWGVVGSSAPLPTHGLVSGIGVGFGLNDTWELRVDAAYAVHPETLHRLRTSVEILYLVDVIQVVPFVGLGAGASFSFTTAMPPLPPDGNVAIRPDLEAHIVAGFDVLLDRDWTIGLVVRPIFQLTSAADDLFYLTVTARAQLLVDL